MTTMTYPKPTDPSSNGENPADTEQPSATRLDLQPNRAANCPDPCRLQARCRLDRPNGRGCPLGRRPVENGRIEAPSPTPSQKPPGDEAREQVMQPPRSHRRTRPREDEWSPGRMQGVTKPSWGGRFASKMRGESGMSTAEYAVGTLAAVAFAGVLLKVLSSETVQGALSELVERALS